MDWKEIKGAEEATPLELNAVSLSSERHSPMAQNDTADPVPVTGGATKTNAPLRKTSLSSLKL